MDPVLLTISASLLVFLAALSTAIVIFRNWRKDAEAFSFGVFWAMVAGVWLFAGLENLLWWLGLPEIYPLASTHIYEAFIILEGPPLVFYLTLRAINNFRLAYLGALVFVVGTVLYVYFNLTEGFSELNISDWAWEYRISETSFQIIQVLYILPTFLVLYALGSDIRRWFKTREEFVGYKFLGVVSLVIYMTTGYFDITGHVPGWHFLFLRIVTVLSALIAFLAYSGGKEEDDFVEG